MCVLYENAERWKWKSISYFCQSLSDCTRWISLAIPEKDTEFKKLLVQYYMQITEVIGAFQRVLNSFRMLLKRKVDIETAKSDIEGVLTPLHKLPKTNLRIDILPNPTAALRIIFAL